MNEKRLREVLELVRFAVTKDREANGGVVDHAAVRELVDEALALLPPRGARVTFVRVELVEVDESGERVLESEVSKRVASKGTIPAQESYELYDDATYPVRVDNSLDRRG